MFAEEYGQIQRKKRRHNNRQSVQNFKSSTNDIFKYSEQDFIQNMTSHDENRILTSFDGATKSPDVTDKLLQGIELRMALPALSNNIETYMNWQVDK